jgi:hypothetical protein
MNNLSNSVYQYYLGHLAELPLDKQLHFTSRLWLWNNDTACRGKLDELRTRILQSDGATAMLRAIASGELVSIGKGTSSAVTLRAPYAAKYPNLRRVAATLYWAKLLDELYDTDLRNSVSYVFDTAELDTLYADLIKDKQALALLSTHAVNFLYLYKSYLLQADGPDPDLFLKLTRSAKLYDLADPLQLQLAIYLLTHSIIGETGFYTRPIPTNRLPAYQKQLRRLESLIRPNFTKVHLDNKFELLVCSALVGMRSALEDQILEEAAGSVSKNGTFIVDTHNMNASSTYATAAKSEHRNALYVMATTEPRSSLHAA